MWHRDRIPGAQRPGPKAWSLHCFRDLWGFDRCGDDQARGKDWICQWCSYHHEETCEYKLEQDYCCCLSVYPTATTENNSEYTFNSLCLSLCHTKEAKKHKNMNWSSVVVCCSWLNGVHLIFWLEEVRVMTSPWSTLFEKDYLVCSFQASAKGVFAAVHAKQ